MLKIFDKNLEVIIVLENHDYFMHSFHEIMSNRAWEYTLQNKCIIKSIIKSTITKTGKTHELAYRNTIILNN